MQKQILIVDGSAASRELLSKALSGTYEILEAETESAAIEAVCDRHSRVSAVLLNIASSGTEGYMLLSALKSVQRIHNLPVLVMTSPSDAASEDRVLELGACDFVTLPFSPSILSFRLKNAIEHSEYAAFQRLRYLAEYDPVSGVYNRAKFYSAARRILDSHPNVPYALIRLDIDRFKAYNDLFGMEAGDQLLAEVGRHIRRHVSTSAVFGHLEADHFVVCLPQSEMNLDVRYKRTTQHFNQYNPNFIFSMHFGVLLIDDPSLEISRMCDRALMALRTTKSGGGRHIALYDESMRTKILEEQALIGDIEAALAGRQFDVYLQPQYNHRTGELVGAEALVRWIHPLRGIIPPSAFIPILEKNGLISQLDAFVCETVCRLLRDWRERNLPRLSISINISRADIYQPDFCQKLVSLTQEYGVDPQDLRLEITETAYMENAEYLLIVIGELQKAGFLIEMDDFGKGYSSLNALKNVPVDALKLDIGFLSRTKGSSDRGGIILSSVMRMARWLNLFVIAEGVETLRQADYLLSIGCDIVQGYLYSRPLPVPEFLDLLRRENVGSFIGSHALLSQIDIKELWHPDAGATTLFESFVGPAGLFTLHDGAIEALRINRKMYELLEGSIEVFPSGEPDLLAALSEEHRLTIQNMLATTVRTGREAVCQILHARSGRRMTHLFFRAGVIAVSTDRTVFFISCEDNTALYRQIERRRWQEQCGHILLEATDSILFDYDPDMDVMSTIRRDPADGLKKRALNRFLADIETVATVHPDSRAALETALRSALRHPGRAEGEFSLDCDGTGSRRYRASSISVADDRDRVYRVVGRLDEIPDGAAHAAPNDAQ